MSKVIAYMADGLEEVECLAVVDVLRRAGIEVVMTSITDKKQVLGSHNFLIGTDAIASEIDPLDADMIFLPGGMPGTKYLTESAYVTKAIKDAFAAGKKLAAICAAPSVLGVNGLLEGKKATCYPGWESALSGAEIVNAGVVRDGNVITGRGLGFAIDEGLEILKAMVDEETSEKIKKAIQHPTTI